MSIIHPKHIGSLARLVRDDDDPDDDVKVIVNKPTWYEYIDSERWWATNLSDPDYYWVSPGALGTIIGTGFNTLPGVSFHYCKVLFPKLSTNFMDQFGTDDASVPAGIYWVAMTALEVVKDT